MANARTRFDTICEYMVRAHGASTGSLYNKPCAMLRGEAFLYFHQNWAAFRLRGRVRLQALALAGAKFWDPLGREGPSMDWVIVPDAHFLRWDRFAVESVKQAEKAAGGRRPEAGPAQGPAPLPPASLRWLDGIKGLLAKAAALTLARQEVVAEKPIPKIFMETGSPSPAEAESFAALAGEATANESAGSLRGDGHSAAAPVAEAVSTGRASFAVPDTEAAAPAVTGRASFVVPDEPAPAPPMASGKASFALPDDPPAPSAVASGGKASFALPDDPPAAPVAASTGKASFVVPETPAPEAVASAGRASFALPQEPAPEVPASVGRASFALPDDTPVDPQPATPPSAPPTVSAEAEATEAESSGADQPDWAARAAKYELEREQPQTPTGRAVFNVPAIEDEPAAGVKLREPDRPMGRASFLLPDDLPAEGSDEPEGIDYGSASDPEE